MTDELSIVLLHGSANGSYSWAAVRSGLEAYGATVVAPDMLGYGRSPTPWRVKATRIDLSFSRRGNSLGRAGRRVGLVR
jgi:pimeloyl-ACP methyl ester carboxylesterase